MKKILVILVLAVIVIVAAMFMNAEVPTPASDTSAAISQELEGITVDDSAADFKELDADLLTL